jgi:hypothetical protein
VSACCLPAAHSVFEALRPLPGDALAAAHPQGQGRTSPVAQPRAHRRLCSQVADFGCTERAVLASVTVETVRGALAYQAPEVLARGVLSPAADCYAFGVLLWEMLTAQARPGCRGSHARLSLNAAGARQSTQWRVDVEDCRRQRAQACSLMLRCGRLLRCSQAAGSLVPGVSVRMRPRRSKAHAHGAGCVWAGGLLHALQPPLLRAVQGRVSARCLLWLAAGAHELTRNVVELVQASRWH